MDIPYEDEIIEPIDDYPNYEANLIDDEVVYRLQKFYTRKTNSNSGSKNEEKIEFIPMKKKEPSVEEVEVNAVVMEPFNDESKIIEPGKK